MFTKRFVLISLVLASLLISCKDNNEDSSAALKEIDLTPVSTLTVKKSDFKEIGIYYGRVQGVKSASIINITGGTVESINVIEGSLVSKGESLALISSDKAQLTLDSAKLNEQIKRENYLALKKFLKSGTSSQLKVDQAKLQWINSQSQLIDAEKAYKGAFCISPIDGVVVSRNIDVENEIYAGSETFLIEDLSQIEIKIGIPEADMAGVQQGSLAQISLDLYPGQIWHGELTRFSRKSSENNLTFHGTILVDNKDFQILSGTTAKVELLRNNYIDNIVLPTEAIIRDRDENYVMVVQGDSVFKRIIELGPTNIEHCVVLSGLEEGEILVVEGLHLLVDAQKVSLIDEEV